MKKGKSFIWILLILLLSINIGCDSKKPAESLPTQVSESSKQEAVLQSGDITNPAELEKLWQEYLYDSITTVGNAGDFASAEEIDPLYVAEFCWFKYYNEHGLESLELAEEGSTLRLFPLDTVLEYAKSYFNVTSLDVSKIEEHSYDPQRRAFLFNLGKEQRRPSHDAPNAWGSRLQKVTRNPDGTITAVLAHVMSYYNSLVDRTKTYTFRQREDESYYFVSGKQEYINNHLVSLTGDYRRFDKIKGFEGSLDAVSLLGEGDGKLIFVYTPYEKGKDPALMLVNPETMATEKMLTIDGVFSMTDVSMIKDTIIIRLYNKVIKVDKSLTHKEESELPDIIKEKINRSPSYNDKGNPDIFFGGYDISADGRRFVYTDEVGLKLYNATDGSDELLSKTVPIKGSELIDNSFHISPRYVADEQKVITTMTGYESAMGYTVFDLDQKTQKVYNIGSEGSSTGLIRYDTGLMEINNFIRDKDDKDGAYKTMYLDFKTEKLTEISMQDPGDTGFISMPHYCYVGQNDSAFITFKQSTSDYTKNMIFLNRLHLDTMQIEPSIITVQGAEAYILGVLNDGRVVFWYNLNPAENGICITK